MKTLTIPATQQDGRALLAASCDDGSIVLATRVQGLGLRGILHLTVEEAERLRAFLSGPQYAKDTWDDVGVGI